MSTDTLSQAISSRLPFVHVKTDDIVHIAEVLSFIAGEPVKGLAIDDKIFNEGIPDGNVFYTACDAPTAKLYLTFKAAGKCLVFVNTPDHVLHFNGGEMFPPKELMKSYLVDMGATEAQATAVLPAYGGMTLKDMFEATKLTVNRAGIITATEVNSTRKGYISKLKGITQIDTDYGYYQVPSYLKKWMDANGPFFSNPVAPELTPRGLLFYGPPGTGKTMGAKYVANEFGLPLYHLDIGGMKHKYVGDSEKNLQAALAQIDQVEPCVVLFDEVEKAFGEQNDAGVTSSLLSTLLWWLQEHKTKVFSIMTTNKKTAIPPELHRPGRIDASMVFRGLETYEEGALFFTNVYNTLGAKIWGTNILPLDKVYMSDKLKILFADGQPVPQAKVNETVLAYTKMMYTLKGGNHGGE